MKVTDAMVDRFLGWKLPDSFSPDDGIHFNRVANKGTPYEYVRTPSGTNLFDAKEARAMLEHVLGGEPDRETSEEERLRNLRLSIAAELYTHQEAMRAASAFDAADAFIAEWKRREGK